jgi:hypothetical protein
MKYDASQRVVLIFACVTFAFIIAYVFIKYVSLPLGEADPSMESLEMSLTSPTSPPLSVAPSGPKDSEHNAALPPRLSPEDPLAIVTPETALHASSAREARASMNLDRPKPEEIETILSKCFSNASRVTFSFWFGESITIDDKYFLEEASSVLKIHYNKNKEDSWLPNGLVLGLAVPCIVSFEGNDTYSLGFGYNNNEMIIWHKTNPGTFIYYVKSDGKYEALIAYYLSNSKQILQNQELLANDSPSLLLDTYKKKLPSYSLYIDDLSRRIVPAVPIHGTKYHQNEVNEPPLEELESNGLSNVTNQEIAPE